MKIRVCVLVVLSFCVFAGCGPGQYEFVSTWANDSPKIYEVFSNKNLSSKLSSNASQKLADAKNKWGINPSTARIALDNNRQRVIVAHGKHTAGLLVDLKKGKWTEGNIHKFAEPGVVGVTGHISNGYYQVTLLVPKSFHNAVLITSDGVEHKIPVKNSIATITVKESGHPRIQYIAKTAEWTEPLLG